MNEQPWYAEFFGADYLRIYTPMLAPERAEQEVALLVERLGLPAGSKILDLCCGHGRHSIPLARRGYQVTGLDLSQVFLEKARVDAEEAGVQVRWVHSDMRHVPFEAEFDAVINMFTAFGYLENEQEDEKVLHQVHGALKPGGLFLLEIAHREFLMRHFESRDFSRYQDGLLVLHERHLDLMTSRLDDQVTMIHPDGTRRAYFTSLRLYSLTELAHMMEAAGLRVEAYYGGLDGSELTLDCHRLVLVARKG